MRNRQDLLLQDLSGALITKWEVYGLTYPVSSYAQYRYDEDEGLHSSRHQNYSKVYYHDNDPI